MVDSFDAETARMEAAVLDIERNSIRLAEETAWIELHTEQITRETEKLREATKGIFNDAVADIGMAIEQAATQEHREKLRALALNLYQSVTPGKRR